MTAFATPSSNWSPQFLDTATYLDLHVAPSHSDASGFVEAMMQMVMAADIDRRNERRAAGIGKLRQAVVSIFGGILRAWSQDALPVYRSNHAEAFTPIRPRRGGANLQASLFPQISLPATQAAQVVGRRPFTTVIDAAKARGLIHHKGGLQLPHHARLRMGQGDKRKSSRYWPTKALLRLAKAHGLTPENVAAAFPVPRPGRPLTWKNLVKLKSFRRRRGDAEQAVFPLPEQDHLDQTKPAFRLRAEVEEHNDFAAWHAVTMPSNVSCYPPQWRRVFDQPPLGGPGKMLVHGWLGWG